MDMDELRTQTAKLRDEAFTHLRSTEAYRVFRALDQAVIGMGGPILASAPNTVGAALTPPAASSELSKLFTGGFAQPPQTKRLSQGDAAAMVLSERGSPMPGNELFSEVPNKGATVSTGEKAVASFTSQLSRDARFFSFRKDGQYFWWLANVPMPSGWNEPESDDFTDLLDSGSSVHSNQETANADNNT